MIGRVPRILLLRGEGGREFVLSAELESVYLAACQDPLNDIAHLLHDGIADQGNDIARYLAGSPEHGGRSAYGISGPSFWGQDLSLKRSFPIHEKIGVLLQMDAINAFNIVMFAAPALNITSANFGKITSQANGPRIVQVSARLTF